MVTKIQRWGNSQGVRFPQQILQEAHIAVGDEVDVTVEGGRIVVVPSNRIRGRYNLADLLASLPEDYQPREEDWGSPVGREECARSPTRIAASRSTSLCLRDVR